MTKEKRLVRAKHNVKASRLRKAFNMTEETGHQRVSRILTKQFNRHAKSKRKRDKTKSILESMRGWQ